MNKKVLSTVLAGTLAVTAVVGGSLAYFTDKDDKTNTFTVGNVDITLTEPNWEGNGSEDAPAAYPGEPLAKDPTVKNDGANPCFVRIKVEGLNSLGDAGMITYRTDYVTDKLGDGWVKGDDGYFYYDSVLEVNETTDALFDQIVMPTGLTNGDGTTEYNVVVTAEAVQAQGAMASWTAVQNMTVEEIEAWFNTCGMNNVTE